MSELINNCDNRATIRWKLLTGASALALTAYVASAGVAGAEDTDHPQLWIELGGQAEHLENPQEPFLPVFATQAPAAIRAPMVSAQKPPLYSLGEEAKISFTPENSDWLFSASIRYGRSNATKRSHYETKNPKVPETFHGAPYHAQTRLFGDAEANAKEAYMVLDFQAGKDVGLGLFGREGTSNVSAGVRFVRFTAHSHATLHARPNYAIGSYQSYITPAYPSYEFKLHGAHFHDYTAFVRSRRSARGVGPSISWNGSVPFAGNAADMEFTLDWGVNAAVLFGRQHTRVHHQTSGTYKVRPAQGTQGYAQSSYAHNPPDQDRSRRVTIPNAGGFAGISLKFPNAKISVGYRGDFFFGAMDNGIDARKSTTLGFNGPFASISFGLGD